LRRTRTWWNDIYASFRAKSVLTGRIIGVDGQAFNVRNRETGHVERRTMYCAVIIAYRVKVLIPETEMWVPGEERPAHVLRNMSGAEIDYVADLPRHSHRGAEQPHAACHVQPVFVQAEGLDLVGVVLVDVPGQSADADILPHIRGEHHQVGTALLRLPDGHPRLNSERLSGVAGREDDAMAVLLAAAHRHGFVPQLRAALHLNGGIESS
jgi:hypothetical protein